MKLRVLGCSGAEFPHMNPPAFLIDESVLLDAGTIAAVLREEEQWAIKDILLTHAHLDHIKGIPFLADNIILNKRPQTVRVTSIASVLMAMKNNLLNDVVWPDFTVLPNSETPVISLHEIDRNEEFMVNGYKVLVRNMNHSVDAIGFIVESPEGRRLLYTGDTGPTEDLWKETATPVHCAIIEVSMPNEMKDMAILTGHLTAELLEGEIRKMINIPERILITHPKPQYLARIKDEIAALGRNNITMLSGDEVIEV